MFDPCCRRALLQAARLPLSARPLNMHGQFLNSFRRQMRRCSGSRHASNAAVVRRALRLTDCRVRQAMRLPYSSSGIVFGKSKFAVGAAELFHLLDGRMSEQLSLARCLSSPWILSS